MVYLMGQKQAKCIFDPILKSGAFFLPPPWGELKSQPTILCIMTEEVIPFLYFKNYFSHPM